MGGPRITISCDCGEQRRVRYGEHYQCVCRRRWSTTQIPEEDYARIKRLDLRYRAMGWVVGLAFASLVLLILLTRPLELLIVIPAGLLGWFAFIRPPVRRKHYRDVQKLTRQWKLRPEP
jgi:hypothetical protein